MKLCRNSFCFGEVDTLGPDVAARDKRNSIFDIFRAKVGSVLNGPGQVAKFDPFPTIRHGGGRFVGPNVVHIAGCLLASFKPVALPLLAPLGVYLFKELISRLVVSALLAGKFGFGWDEAAFAGGF